MSANAMSEQIAGADSHDRNIDRLPVADIRHIQGVLGFANDGWALRARSERGMSHTEGRVNVNRAQGCAEVNGEKQRIRR